MGEITDHISQLMAGVSNYEESRKMFYLTRFCDTCKKPNVQCKCVKLYEGRATERRSETDQFKRAGVEDDRPRTAGVYPKAGGYFEGGSAGIAQKKSDLTIQFIP